MIPITASVKTRGPKARLASGNSGRQKRRKPYVPILRSTPARMTLPAVGASTWASGSQVWNGNSGTLIAKARAKARNMRFWALPGAITYWASTSRARSRRREVIPSRRAPVLIVEGKDRDQHEDGAAQRVEGELLGGVDPIRS